MGTKLTSGFGGNSGSAFLLILSILAVFAMYVVLWRLGKVNAMIQNEKAKILDDESEATVPLKQEERGKK